MEAQCLTVDLKQLSVSPLNPRAVYDEAADAELAADVKAHGLMQPLLVRQTGPKTYEVVDGSRRFKAAQAAGLQSVPVRLFELDDQAAAVRALVANDSNEHLTPLERADGYKRLRDEYGFTPEQIAEKVSKSVTTVKRTLNLLNLTAESRESLAAGKVSLTVAKTIATAVSPAKQARVMKWASTKDQYSGKLPTEEQVSEHVNEHYMRELKTARFSTSDAKLCPDAGPCTTCPKRSGAQVELFVEGSKVPDKCLDLPCWDRKENAWLKLKLAAGSKLLTAAEAKKLYPHGNDHLGYDAPYVEADSRADYSDTPGNTWRKKLGKEADAAIVFARAPSGALVEMLPRDVLPKGKASPASRPAPHKKDAAEIAREKKHALNKAIAAKVVTELAEHNNTSRGTDAWLKTVLEGVLPEYQNETKKQLAKWLGLIFDDAEQALLEHGRSLQGAELRAFLTKVSQAARLSPYINNPDPNERLKGACKLNGIEYGELAAKVAREVKEAERAKAAEKGSKKGKTIIAEAVEKAAAKKGRRLKFTDVAEGA